MYNVEYHDTNFLLQKKATHSTIITKARLLTINTRHIIPNIRHIIPNTRPLTTNHANIIPNTRPLTTNNANQQMVADNIDLAKKQMQTISRITKNWLKVESKEIVHEEFPPYESIIIYHRNKQLLASPMKNVSLSDETKNFEKIIEQNNYSNTYLKIIGTKLDRIKNKIDPIKPTTKLDIEKPLFTPHEIPPKLHVSFKKDNTNVCVCIYI